MPVCPYCNEIYDDGNESQPCCGICGYPYYHSDYDNDDDNSSEDSNFDYFNDL